MASKYKTHFVICRVSKYLLNRTFLKQAIYLQKDKESLRTKVTGKDHNKRIRNKLTFRTKGRTIYILIHYRSVPGKPEPAFAGLADLQDPTPKSHGFRMIAHNPEVVGSNPTPATKMAPKGAICV